MAAQWLGSCSGQQPPKIKWQYRNSDDTEWKDMDAAYAALHEQMLQNRVNVFEYDVQYCHGRKNYHYVVDLDARTQFNTNTNKTRALRRLLVFSRIA